MLHFFYYPSCTDSVKPNLQFSCNFVVIYASEGSHFFLIFIPFYVWVLGINVLAVYLLPVYITLNNIHVYPFFIQWRYTSYFIVINLTKRNCNFQTTSTDFIIPNTKNVLYRFENYFASIKALTFYKNK
jgi:hypothetical protein